MPSYEPASWRRTQQHAHWCKPHVNPAYESGPKTVRDKEGVESQAYSLYPKWFSYENKKLGKEIEAPFEWLNGYLVY